MKRRQGHLGYSYEVTKVPKVFDPGLQPPYGKAVTQDKKSMEAFCTASFH
jgi:hypothetical protein